MNFPILSVMVPKNTKKKNTHNLTCLARFPKTKSIASMTLLFPLPLGPTTAEKLCTVGNFIT